MEAARYDEGSQHTTPSQRTLLIYTINTPYHHTTEQMEAARYDEGSQHTTPSQYTLSTHPLKIPYQHTYQRTYQHITLSITYSHTHTLFNPPLQPISIRGETYISSFESFRKAM